MVRTALNLIKFSLNFDEFSRRAELQKSQEVAASGLGPMALGMLSASAYAMLSSELMLLWHPVLGCATWTSREAFWKALRL